MIGLERELQIRKGYYEGLMREAEHARQIKAADSRSARRKSSLRRLASWFIGWSIPRPSAVPEQKSRPLMKQVG